MRQRTGKWIAGLIIVLVAVGGTGYRFSALRAASNETLVEAQRLQQEQASLQGVVEVYEAGFLLRPVQAFRPGFVSGAEWVSDMTRLDFAWEEPSDGIYLSVDWTCPWSQEAVDAALEIADRSDREVILLDPVVANGPKWRSKYSSATRRLRVVTPADGWWSIGVPDGITPGWFAVAGGQFAAIGAGTA